MDRNPQQDTDGTWYSMQPDHSLNRAEDGVMSPRITAAVDRLAEGLDIPAELLTGSTGPIITPPEQLPPGSFLPYEKQDRTPAALQQLEALAANVLDIDPQRLISLRGDVIGEGAVAMFTEQAERMATVTIGYVVVSTRGGDRKPTVSRYGSISAADEAYDRRRGELV